MTGHIAGGMFHWESLMWHSIAYAAGQLEPWLTVCREIQGPLGMVLIGVWENPGFVPLKSATFRGSMYRHLIHSSLGPPESTSGISIGSAVFAQLTVLTDQAITSVAIDRVVSDVA